MKNILKSTALAAIFSCLAPLVSLLKVSFIVGSRCALFSFGQCLTPLAGAFGGISVSLVVFVSQLLWYKTCGASLFLICPLATFCGALHFSLLPKKWLATLIPLSCIVLFMAHPNGFQVAWYSLFWAIPLCTLLIPHRSFFLNALGSTFTTHAVGTVLWLYAKNLSPELFVSLVPIVIAERLLFAAGMTMTYYAINWLVAKIPTIMASSPAQETEHA